MAGYRMKYYRCMKITPAIRSCLLNIKINDPEPGEKKTLNWCVRNRLIAFQKDKAKYVLLTRGMDIVEFGRCWIHKNEKLAKLQK